MCSPYFHRGRGFKGRGRGGRMSRGGMRGGRGTVKAFGPAGRGRGRGKDGAMNGFGPMRYLFGNVQNCAKPFVTRKPSQVFMKCFHWLLNAV